MKKAILFLLISICSSYAMRPVIERSFIYEGYLYFYHCLNGSQCYLYSSNDYEVSSEDRTIKVKSFSELAVVYTHRAEDILNNGDQDYLRYRFQLHDREWVEVIKPNQKPIVLPIPENATRPRKQIDVPLNQSVGQLLERIKDITPVDLDTDTSGDRISGLLANSNSNQKAISVNQLATGFVDILDPTNKIDRFSQSNLVLAFARTLKQYKKDDQSIDVKKRILKFVLSVGEQIPLIIPKLQKKEEKHIFLKSTLNIIDRSFAKRGDQFIRSLYLRICSHLDFSDFNSAFKLLDQLKESNLGKAMLELTDRYQNTGIKILTYSILKSKRSSAVRKIPWKEISDRKGFVLSLLKSLEKSFEAIDFDKLDASSAALRLGLTNDGLGRTLMFKIVKEIGIESLLSKDPQGASAVFKSLIELYTTRLSKLATNPFINEFDGFNFPLHMQYRFGKHLSKDLIRLNLINESNIADFLNIPFNDLNPVFNNLLQIYSHSNSMNIGEILFLSSLRTKTPKSEALVVSIIKSNLQYNLRQGLNDSVDDLSFESMVEKNEYFKLLPDEKKKEFENYFKLAINEMKANRVKSLLNKRGKDGNGPISDCIQ